MGCMEVSLDFVSVEVSLCMDFVTVVSSTAGTGRRIRAAGRARGDTVVRPCPPREGAVAALRAEKGERREGEGERERSVVQAEFFSA